ncbi:MAG: hypothetical protein ABI647_14165 [Gemmatimonadota bacterium]
MRFSALPFVLAFGVGLVGCREAPKPAAQAARDSAAAPAPPPAPAPSASAARGDTIPLSVVAIAAGTGYQTEGKGACENAADASIFGTAASLWRASYTEPGHVALRHVNLTIWQPKGGGPAQITLAVQVEARTYDIATVKGGKIVGQGTATVERKDEGATLTVDGTAGDGTSLRVAVVCSRVGEVASQGG